MRRLLLVLAGLAAVLAGPAAAGAAAKPVDNVLPEVVGNPLLGERLVCGAGSWSGGVSRFEFRWLRAGISVGTGATYTLKSADAGMQVWCVVTAVGGSERAEAESVNSVELPGEHGGGQEPEAPSLATSPEVSGTPAVGQTLTCSEGSWTGYPTPSVTYKWLREKEPITGATANTHNVVSEDEGHSLSCKVTASNSAGSATAESANSLKIPGKAPKNAAVPVVLGTAEVAHALTCAEGVWEGSQPLTLQFQWQRNGTAIPMATGSTYFVEIADEGQSLSCKVTATNSQGSISAGSVAVTVRRATPMNTIPPEIKGETELAAILTCSAGTWTGSPTEYEYEWLRETQPVTLESTKNTYTVVSADRGHSLYCEVTARNGGGEATRSSGPFVIPENTGGHAPQSVGQPLVSGTAQAGGELACSEGEWNYSPGEFLYQWIRDAGLEDEVNIESGTTNRYGVSSADEGHDLSCRVTAVNREGSATAESERLRVSGSKPVSTAPSPEISGNARVGESLTCLRGGWKAAPQPTFAYQWLRDGAEIATGYAYTIAGADRGHSLSCVVTATNDEGDGTAETGTLYILGSPPEGGAPVVVGSPEVGATLECSRGEWSGAPQPAFAYQWLLGGVAIPSEVASTYAVTSSDRGLVISCSVTATSREGTASATSKGVHVIGLKPQAVEAPQVSGTATLGQTLTCERGIWRAAPPPMFTYHWLRDGSSLPGATASTYTVEPADQGHLLSCNVTAANIEGSIEAESSNGVAIPIRTSTGAGVASITPTGPGATQPSAAIIFASLRRELTKAQHGLRLSAVLKGSGCVFPFTAPSAGTLELLWYQATTAAHGSTKQKLLLVGRASVAFTAASKRTVHLKLTAKGRQALKGKKRVKLAVVAVFSVANSKPVTWTETLVLSR